MESPSPLVAALTGLGFSLSLIVAIGAQNAFVLRQGLRREHVAWVVAFCALSDAALIALGVAGAGAVVSAAPWVLTVARVGGAIFLAGYAVVAARRAIRPGALRADTAGGRSSLGRVIAVCAALTWLNPHVYLDTVVLLGSVAAGTSSGAEPWFAGGAMAGSAIWFSLLGFGARVLRPLFARPAAWRVLDGFVAVVMAVLAVTLVVEVWG